jgi:hypothetical protein
MKRLVVALLFALVALSPAARADEPIGCGLTSAPLMAQPDGSILIGCTGGVTDAFGEQLVLVLNRILQNRIDPLAVLAKLDEVDGVPDEGVARAVNEVQRHAIIEALSGKEHASVAIVAHPLVEDSAEFAKGIATPLTMVGWQIEGNQIRRAAPKAIENIAGVAIVVRNRDAVPPKALQLKKALAAGSIAAQLVSDPGVPEGGAMIWVGRRQVFMQADAAKR